LVGVRAYRSDELLDHILVLDYRIQNALVFMEDAQALHPEWAIPFGVIRGLLEVKK
jgi:hypothetical protein